MREIEFLLKDNETVGTWIIPADMSMEEAKKKQDDVSFRKHHMRGTRPFKEIRLEKK
jgi:hypothetical protein